MPKFDPSKFTSTKAKPLPVLLLLDVSGSMGEVVGGPFQRTGERVVEDGQTWDVVTGGVSRIDVLNQAVREMLAALAKEEQLGHEFLVSVITFGEAVRTHLPPTKASLVEWAPLTAAGETPMGEAITSAKRLVEDKETTPSRAYRPVVVLVSDGKPTDAWQQSVKAFVEDGRSSKCDRMAVAIGAGTDEEMLRKFLAGAPSPLFHADDAKQIHDAFRRVTMSVTVRSKSKDPNLVAGLAPALDVPGSGQGPAPQATPAATAPNPAAVANDDDGYW